jgi:hypothetical protein
MLLLLLVSSKNRFMDGPTPERLLKAENKSFLWHGRDTKKMVLDEVIWEKKWRNNSSSLISF